LKVILIPELLPTWLWPLSGYAETLRSANNTTFESAWRKAFCNARDTEELHSGR
jgi:hypothetical protein